MSVLGRVLFSSAERLDLSDLLSVESYVASDFKYLVQSFVGTDAPYILKGFEVIGPADSIGAQSISISIADSVVYFPTSTAGSFYYGMPEGHEYATPLIPELKKNATNYVYLTLSTINIAQDTRAFWDPDKESGAGGEFTQDVNTESALSIVANVSTSAFPTDTIPVCKVVVGTAGIESIEDCRQLLFRLGTGGTSPDPLYSHQFPSLPSSDHARKEPISKISSSTGANPFQGADKNITTLKEWMNVVMTKIKELSGTAHWYDDVSAFNLVSMFKDTLATSIRSKGSWDLDAIVPGLLSWTETINIKSMSDPRDIMVVGPGSKTLANEQIMYIELERNKAINNLFAPVYWTQGQTYVNGDSFYFENLKKGDWIKPADAEDYDYYRVEEFFLNLNATGGTASPSTAKSIKISRGYSGLSASYLSTYTKGVYQPTDVLIADRTDPVLTEAGGNFYWLASRSDTVQNIGSIQPTAMVGTVYGNGSNARYVTSGPHGMQDGDQFTISGSMNFDGTYIAQVESSNTVYFVHSSIETEESVQGYYALVTTAARNTEYALELESANHNFEDESNVIIAGTDSGYDGTFKIKTRNLTQFTIPVPTLISTVTTGTATLVGTNVRTEGGPSRMTRGSERQIGSVETPNLLKFVGMTSEDQAYPPYQVPTAYNTLQGSANFNAYESDNVSVRLSRLTSMMADRAQDKEILMAAENITTVTNVTSGSSQLLSFAGNGPKLTIAMPGSPGGIVHLGGTLTLAQNQAAYFTIDRNQSFSTVNLDSLSVVSVSSVPVAENVFVLAYRSEDSNVFLWNGHKVSLGTFTFWQDLTDSVRTRLGVLSGDTFEAFTNTKLIQTSDSYPVAISRLDANVDELINDRAIEESQLVTSPSGTATFVASTMEWSSSNATWDIEVYVNGVKQEMDVTGGSADDFCKVGTSTLQFSYTIPQYAIITVREARPLQVTRATSTFRYDTVGAGGISVYTGYNYSTGEEQLQVFRNGVAMIHSTVIGEAVDRYIEASKNTVTLATRCGPDELLSFVNLPTAPTYRQFTSGLTGTALTVPSYATSTKRLLVFRNGLLMNFSGLGDAEDKYTESNSTTITLTSAASAPDVFEFLYMGTAPSHRNDTASVAGATVNLGFTGATASKLLVFRNGILMTNSTTLGAAVEQYQLASDSSITLQQAATLGEVFTFILLG